MFLFIGWIILSFIFASAGENKKIGYWGCFLCCVLLTPVIGLIIGLVSPTEIKKIECKNCHFQKNEADYYCPRCGKDNEGFTLDDNKTRTFTSPAKEIPKKSNTIKQVVIAVVIAFVILLILQMLFGRR